MFASSSGNADGNTRVLDFVRPTVALYDSNQSVLGQK